MVSKFLPVCMKSYVDIIYHYNALESMDGPVMKTLG